MLVTKLICKTIGITLLVVTLLTVAFLGILSLASPLTMAQACDKIGWYSTSIYFYDRNYAKTGSVSDLDMLISKIDDEGDSVRAEVYLSWMLNHKDYDAFCVTQDGNQIQLVITTDEYYTGKYASVLITNDKFDLAKSISNTFVTENGYTKHNPYRTIIYSTRKLTLQQIQAIESDLNIFVATITKQDQLNIIQEDLVRLQYLKQEITQ